MIRGAGLRVLRVPSRDVKDREEQARGRMRRPGRVRDLRTLRTEVSLLSPILTGLRF